MVRRPGPGWQHGSVPGGGPAWGLLSSGRAVLRAREDHVWVAWSPATPPPGASVSLSLNWVSRRARRAAASPRSAVPVLLAEGAGADGREVDRWPKNFPTGLRGSWGPTSAWGTSGQGAGGEGKPSVWKRGSLRPCQPPEALGARAGEPAIGAGWLPPGREKRPFRILWGLAGEQGRGPLAACPAIWRVRHWPRLPRGTQGPGLASDPTQRPWGQCSPDPHPRPRCPPVLRPGQFSLAGLAPRHSPSSAGSQLVGCQPAPATPSG